MWRNMKDFIEQSSQLLDQIAFNSRQVKSDPAVDANPHFQIRSECYKIPS